MTTHMPGHVRVNLFFQRRTEHHDIGRRQQLKRTRLQRAPSITECPHAMKQEAQLMLTTGSTRLAVSRGQQTWYHSTCNI